MTHPTGIDNKIMPLRNVAALDQMIARLQAQRNTIDKMGVLFGPTGFGKTYASCFANDKRDAIYVAAHKHLRAKDLFTTLIGELRSGPVKGTIADRFREAADLLGEADRPLIIDEADYAVANRLVEEIRDLHDHSLVPVIFVGMELLPQKLKEWELIDGRIQIWQPAEPANLSDAQILSRVFAPDIEIDDALLDHITRRNDGKVRRICSDLEHVLAESQVRGVTTMSLDQWGDAPFLRAEAPAPRKGMFYEL
ncbi:AAA family ATPase [Thalassococcus sp. S3]|uniref:AAA family ATPase n=1 Tax=Thalassococcus sp. S3 TaxID=2017482 RepID=UPI0013EE59B7|nr:ATP-binding protein [Thalassococcus sp. S3]